MGLNEPKLQSLENKVLEFEFEETRPRSQRSVWLCGDLWQASSSKICFHMCTSLFEKKLTVTSKSNIKVFDLTQPEVQVGSVCTSTTFHLLPKLIYSKNISIGF